MTVNCKWKYYLGTVDITGRGFSGDGGAILFRLGVGTRRAIGFSS